MGELDYLIKECTKWLSKGLVQKERLIKLCQDREIIIERIIIIIQQTSFLIEHINEKLSLALLNCNA